MPELIDYDYMGTDKYNVSIALNGLCQHHKGPGKIVFINVFYKDIGMLTSERCRLIIKGIRLPECVECLVTRVEGLYDKANRL